MHRVIAGGIAVMLFATVSSPALAQADAQGNVQDGAQDAGQDTLGDDVVVTAQKREQSIAEVPITITAVTGQRMADIGVNSLSEVALYVPGLRVQEQSANNPGIVIRGITSDSGSSQQGARVTLYYNGVDISRSRGSYQDLYDISRVEVIKGPQATLFGTASAIGAISVISNPAEPGFSAGLTASYGNYDRSQVLGFVNAGNDVIAGRLAFAYKFRDGYVRNIAGSSNAINQNQGRVDQDDLNGQDQRGLRGSLRFMPSDAITADLVVTYDGQRNPGTAFKSRAFAPSGGQTGDYGVAELSGSPFSDTVLGKRKLGLDRDVYDANLTVSVDLGGGVSFTTVNGYRKFDSLETFDADGGPAWYLEFAEDAHGDQWSHEGRFNFTGSKLRASFGWNAFTENGFQRVPFSTEEGTYIACSVTGGFAPFRGILAAQGVPTGPACVAPNGTIPAAGRATPILTRATAQQIPYSSEFTNYGNNDAYSVFGEATWSPTLAIELTAGARVLIEDRKSGFSSIQPNSTILASFGVNTSLLGTANTRGVILSATRSYSAILPRFNALYRFADGFNGYATVSKGRRSPVVQVGAFAGNPATRNLQLVPEENTWNYEAGIKAGSGRLQGTVSVYYQTYDGFQVSVTDAMGRVTTQSAGTANNLGFEADATFRVSSALQLFGSFGYIDGGISDAALPNGGTNVFAGNRFRLQPEIVAAGGAILRQPIRDGLVFYATPSATYQSSVFFELPNNPAISQGGYVLVNLRAGIELADGRYRIGGFARNLLDRRYLIDAGNTGGGFGVPTYISGEPRLYGIELSGKF